MQNFTRCISIEQNFNPEFFFNQIHTVRGTRYHISVVDKQGDTCFFNMESMGNGWKIMNAPGIPGWIRQVETQLEDAIFENLAA